MAISNKHVSKQALEQNEHQRALYTARIGQFRPEQLIFIDESSVDARTSQRREGWAEIGRDCVRRMTQIRGINYSVLPALSLQGIEAIDIIEGAVDKERFLDFVHKTLVPVLRPYPRERSVVVMDNCAIHHDEAIREAIEDYSGAKLIHLSPYSPDFNPIEEAFSFMKKWLRRRGRFDLDADRRTVLIEQALDAITPDLAASWFRNCGYF